jgi:hypothetical protein
MTATAAMSQSSREKGIFVLWSGCRVTVCPASSIFKCAGGKGVGKNDA